MLKLLGCLIWVHVRHGLRVLVSLRRRHRDIRSLPIVIFLEKRGAHGLLGLFTAGWCVDHFLRFNQDVVDSGRGVIGHAAGHAVRSVRRRIHLAHFLTDELRLAPHCLLLSSHVPGHCPNLLLISCKLTGGCTYTLLSDWIRLTWLLLDAASRLRLRAPIIRSACRVRRSILRR